MGRLNFGPKMVDDRKGITEKVTLAGVKAMGRAQRARFERKKNY